MQLFMRMIYSNNYSTFNLFNNKRSDEMVQIIRVKK